MNRVYAIRLESGRYLNFRSLEVSPNNPVAETYLYVQCLCNNLIVAQTAQYEFGGTLIRVELNEVN